ncbi:hypothetical protein [Azospirillum sp. ST 5-10]
MFPAAAVLPAFDSVALRVTRSAYGRTPERVAADRSTVPDPRPPRVFS